MIVVASLMIGLGQGFVRHALNLRSPLKGAEHDHLTETLTKA